MCAVCLHALSCSSAVCCVSLHWLWSSGSQSNCRAEAVCCSLCGSVAAQPAPLWCHWLLVVKYLRKWEPHWTRAECCTFLLHRSCSLIFSGFDLSLTSLSPAVILVMTDPWEIFILDLTQCLNSPPLCWWACLWVLPLANAVVAFSVLTEDSITESAPCWGPQRPPASSLEMLHVSTRAAILRQHHKQWWESSNSPGRAHFI